MSLTVTHQPLESLDFSEEFLSVSKQMGYATLQDIISEQPEVLTRKGGFTQHWFSQLCRYLIKIDALHLLQEIRGNNPV